MLEHAGSANLWSHGGVETNGRQPLPRHGIRVGRRVGITVGAVTAILLAVVLVAPVVFGSQPVSSCARTLRYQGLSYTARQVTGSAVQRLAIGIGVTSGCGRPSNVDLRSLESISVSRAVAVSGESGSVYVRRGICAKAERTDLLRCLQHGQ